MSAAVKSADQHAEGSHLINFVNKIIGQPASYANKKNYTFGKTLGAGSFGIVRYARNNVTGEDVAMKIILKKALKGNEAMVLEEIKLLEELHNSHIVGFRDWFESKDKFYIATQLATGGELFDRIVQQGRFTEHDASLVIIQMLEALQYLHERDIVHRDIKPENVLYLTPKTNSPIVLADFGIAKRLQNSDEKLLSSAGSFGYAAPEVILGTGHGKPCDIWSLGVVTYTILCGYSPFRSENVTDFINEVKHNNAVIFHADYWKDVSKDARRFIVKALQYNPDNRPTATELLNHPWLVSIAKKHTDADLLPQLKERFDAKAKFRQAIELVKLHNRINKLKAMQTEEDDDPTEINMFNSNGDVSDDDSTKKSDHSAPSSTQGSALNNWKKFNDSLKATDADSIHTKSSLTDTTPKQKGLEPKTTAAGDAFVQLVHAASKNKERVESYKDKQ
ncbi:CMK2 [Candida margitis]|uniref:CMK2 n=1 Tax=Candida margitis TaxID=1775924 RepID=UPI002226EF76|nr:CMK2 [Candida margitis]KAI5957924.1 CMK2 [Candida margitis]